MQNVLFYHFWLFCCFHFSHIKAKAGIEPDGSFSRSAADGLYFLCPFERRKRQLRKLENYTPTKFMAADSTYNKDLRITQSIL